MLSKTSGEKVRGWIQEVLYSSNRKSEAEMTDNGRGRRRRGRKKSKTQQKKIPLSLKKHAQLQNGKITLNSGQELVKRNIRIVNLVEISEHQGYKTKGFQIESNLHENFSSAWKMPKDGEPVPSEFWRRTIWN